ncbi:hypothetical protein HDV00_001645, partial [Rhizophlyctis rosea]
MDESSSEEEDAPRPSPPRRSPTKKPLQKASNPLLIDAPPPAPNPYLDDQAAEEEDEFFGVDGSDDAEGEDGGEGGDDDMTFAQILELHRKQEDEKDLGDLGWIRDNVTTGKLRRKQAKGLARRHKDLTREGVEEGRGLGLLDSDEDDEELLRRLRGRHRVDVGAEEEEWRNPMEVYASNPETAAFARCFEMRDDEEEEGGGVGGGAGGGGAAREESGIESDDDETTTNGTKKRKRVNIRAMLYDGGDVGR